MKKVIILIGLLLLLVGAASAQDLWSTGSGYNFSAWHQFAQYNGTVIYNDTTDGISLVSSTMEDGAPLNVLYVSPHAVSTDWGDGINSSASNVIYTYSKNSTSIIKGKIVEKDQMHNITFPITLPPNEMITPYNGFRVISSDPTTQAVLNDWKQGVPPGIQIPQPTAVDANGSVVEVWYSNIGTSTAPALELMNEPYADSRDGGMVPIVYPVTVDPSYFLSAYNSFLVSAMHFNSTIVPDGGTYAGGYTNSGTTYDTTTPIFGSASLTPGVLGNNVHSTSGNAGFIPVAGTAWTEMYWVNMTTAGIPAANFWMPGTRTGDVFSTLGNSQSIDNTNNLIWQISTGSAQWGLVAPSGGKRPYANIRTQVVDEIFPNNTMMEWINGTLAGTASGSGTIATTPNSIFFPISDGGTGSAAGGDIDEWGVWSGTNIPITTLYPQTNEIGTQIGVTTLSQFVTSNTGGTGPVSTTFTDESIGSPATHGWNYTAYANGVYSSGPTQFSTALNPSFTFGVSGQNLEYFITETTSGPNGNGVSVQNTWINTTAVKASFSQNLTTQNVPQGVQFTDTSTNSPASWGWNFGDVPNYYNSSLVLLMHENLTPFTDDSNNHATVSTVGSPSLGTGIFNGALSLDNRSYLSLPASTNYVLGNASQSFTISWWMNITSPSQMVALTNFNVTAPFNGWYITATPGVSGMLLETFTGGALNSASGPGVVPVFGWHHYAVIGNGGTVTVYQDGVAGSPVSINIGSHPGVSLEVGSYYPGGNVNVTGQIDELAIWKGVALPISALYPLSGEIQSPFPFAQSTSQNPSYTFSAIQNYTVTELAYDQYGGISKATGNFNGTIGAPFASFTESLTSGLPGVAVGFTDASSYGTASSLTCNWSYGDGAGTQPYSSTCGSTTHVYNYGGIFTPKYNITNSNGTSTFTGPQITVSNNQNTQNTWWTPHTVQITVMDLNGARLPGVTIAATYNRSSMPTAWIQQLYGIQSSPGSDMVNSSLVIGGVTGSDGTLTSTMLGSLQYNFVLNSVQYGLTNYTVYGYPSDGMFNIYVMPANQQLIGQSANNTYVQLNGTRSYTVWANTSFVSMCIDFIDNTGSTQYVNETWMFKNNDSVVNTANFTYTQGTTVTNCYQVPNIKGTAYWWWANATRSF